MKKFLTYCILFIISCTTTPLVAQQDSLLKKYNNQNLPDTTRLLALYDLIWEKIYTSGDSAEKLIQKGLNDPMTQKRPLFRSKFYNAYGALSQSKSDYVSAINYYQNGLKINERYNDMKGQAVMLGNIGSIYIKLQQNETALNYLRKCLAALKKINDEYNQASVYNNMCIIHSSLQQFDLAMQYAKKSTEIYTKFNDKIGLTYCYANIAAIYEKQGKNEDALVEYKKAAELAKETDNLNEYAITLAECGNIYFLKKDYKEALSYLEKAKSIASEIEDFDALTAINDFLYQYYKALNKTDLALKYYEKHHELKELVSSQNKKDEINRLRFESEYAIKTQQDSIKMANERLMNQEKLKAQNAEIARAKTEKTAFIVFIILLIVVSVVIYNRFRLTQQQKLIIEAKNKQTEEQKLIIEEKQKEIVDSINYAKRIQDSLLDNFESVRKFFSEAFVLNKPKDIVSGDFYWISKRIQETKQHSEKESTVKEMFFIAVCDSTGHGVPGGFMSLLNMAYLSESVNEKNIYEPNKIFDYVRERLINTISKNDQKDGFDGVLMLFEKVMSFSNKTLVNTSYHMSYAAAYNSPILIRNKELQELDADKMPVGFGERNENFTLYKLELNKGDLIYVYTDGYADQFGGPRGKKFKYKQLNELLLSLSNESLHDQSKKLENTFEDWKGNIEQVDDVCIIGIKI